jgi:hypothetical protein
MLDVIADHVLGSPKTVRRIREDNNKIFPLSRTDQSVIHFTDRAEYTLYLSHGVGGLSAGDAL